MKIGTVTLDNDMLWTDEYGFTTATGVSARALDGHLSVQVASLQGGRPMTLSSDPDFGWQKRSTVEALQLLANDPTQTFEVELPDTRTFTCMLRVTEEPVMSFTPAVRASAPGDDFWYYGTINLWVV